MKTTGLILLPLLLITGCNQGDTETTTTLPISSVFSSDPCAVALTTVDRQSQDTEISRSRKTSRNRKQLAAELEKLGWAYVAKARKEFNDGYYLLALNTARCMDKNYENSVQAGLLEAHVLHQLHKFEAAEELARRLVRLRGHWVEYAILGDVLMEQGELVEAEQAYQVMMNQRPGPQAYARAAQLRWLTGDLDGAIEIMRDAAHFRMPWMQTRLAFFLYQAGMTEQAGQVIDDTLSKNPGHAPAMTLRGRILLAEGLSREAVPVLQRASEINPLPENRWLLIEALRASNNAEQALQVETRLKQTGAQDDPRTYALYLSTHDTDTALALQLARAELANRKDVFSLDAMAWALYSESDISRAVQFINHAVSRSTRDARLYMHAALIHRAAGNTARARYWFTKAQRLQHQLLPSEKNMLFKEFAVQPSQKHTSQTTRRELNSTGAHDEKNI